VLFTDNRRSTSAGGSGTNQSYFIPNPKTMRKEFLRKKMKFLPALLLLLCTNMSVVLAKNERAPVQITVSGTVRSNDDNSALPGVNVLVKGTTVGVTTDASGLYTIQCDENSTLVFSFIGYKTHRR
jgi:hypothetical protein